MKDRACGRCGRPGMAEVTHVCLTAGQIETLTDAQVEFDPVNPMVALLADALAWCIGYIEGTGREIPPFVRRAHDQAVNPVVWISQDGNPTP